MTALGAEELGNEEFGGVGSRFGFENATPLTIPVLSLRIAVVAELGICTLTEMQFGKKLCSAVRSSTLETLTAAPF